MARHAWPPAPKPSAVRPRRPDARPPFSPRAANAYDDRERAGRAEPDSAVRNERCRSVGRKQAAEARELLVLVLDQCCGCLLECGDVCAACVVHRATAGGEFELQTEIPWRAVAVGQQPAGLMLDRVGDTVHAPASRRLTGSFAAAPRAAAASPAPIPP